MASNGVIWWGELLKSVGIPAGICIFFMFGVFKVVETTVVPITLKHTEAVIQTMETNNAIVHELQAIRELSLGVATSTDRFRELVIENQTVITENQKLILENQRALSNRKND